MIIPEPLYFNIRNLMVAWCFSFTIPNRGEPFVSFKEWLCLNPSIYKGETVLNDLENTMQQTLIVEVYEKYARWLYFWTPPVFCILAKRQDGNNIGDFGQAPGVLQMTYKSRKYVKQYF